MTTVNIFQAKSQLSKLVHEVESGAQDEIIIARNGRPAARLVPLGKPSVGVRLGVAEGLFVVPDDIDALNPLIAEMFYGKDEPEGE
jgi:prevent-host-death family protein